MVQPASAGTDVAHSGQAPVPPRSMAAVHLDLDGVRHIFRVRGWHYRNGPDALLASTLPLALDLFEEAGVRATLFAIAEDLDDARACALLLDAVRRGHEVASHTVSHRRLTTLSTAEKAREIRESRERLEQALGTAVDGFRAPDFSFDRECLALVAAAGYTYDSSRIARQTAAAASGLQPAPAGAHRPLPDHPLLELPLPGHAPLPFPFHPSYSLVLGERYFRFGLRRVTRADDPFILLFHLIDFADALPAHLLRGAAQRLYTLSFRTGHGKRAACRRMLSVVSAAYDVAPTRAIVQALRARPTSAAQGV